eukprot:CAMPEP_0119116292 /NCGR_PEP_ID=MMETSP1180-20130426/52201_1 /TAXON_ID=3052 ORGANISM="Chlamydomonas cf sp, Strain CCMP681" /NCGR_SAMPLE_ID=MMETSP1180 /ASSEMBLY_ACC=CAM_ASM_000741 /LENGTH=456 /DNA_ID=CAMNT_0007105421 /DNA_START=95 /DNA_END=1465 /DNA_ORIENTATION=+
MPPRPARLKAVKKEDSDFVAQDDSDSMSGSESVPEENSDADFSEDEKPKKKPAAKKPPVPKKAAVKKEDTAVKKEAVAVKKEAAAVKKEAAAVKKETTAVKKGAAPKKSPTKSKRKLESESEDEDDDYEGDYEDEDKPNAKKAKATKPKKPRVVNIKFTAITVLEDGWTVCPGPPDGECDSYLMFKDFNSITSNKIAAFDFDGTLANTESGSPFPQGPNDYQIYNADVAPKLQQYAADGYKIVIFSNQGGVRTAMAGKASENFRGRVQALLKEVNVPALVLAAPSKDAMRKPETGMWDYMVKNFCKDGPPDMKASFFVGDNAGGDDARADEMFAENVGVAFRLALTEFGPPIGTDGGGGPNAELVVAISSSSAFASNSFGKAGAIKAAEALKAFPDKIDKAMKKRVLALANVGAGTWKKIEEFLDTGTLACFTALPPAAGGPALKTKGASDAARFM